MLNSSVVLPCRFLFTYSRWLRRYKQRLPYALSPNLQVWALVEEAGQSAGLHPIRVCVRDIAICPCYQRPRARDLGHRADGRAATIEMRYTSSGVSMHVR